MRHNRIANRLTSDNRVELCRTDLRYVEAVRRIIREGMVLDPAPDMFLDMLVEDVPQELPLVASQAVAALKFLEVPPSEWRN